MIKAIFLAVVSSFILWVGYHVYEQQAGLITIENVKEVSKEHNLSNGPVLVEYDANKKVTRYYAGDITTSFLDMIWSLWPVLLFFALIILVLSPLSYWIFKGFYNNEIHLAIEQKNAAKKEAQQAILDAEKKIHNIEYEASQRISEAHDAERIAARNELDKEWAAYHHKRNEIIERENAIAFREKLAEDLSQQAEDDIEWARDNVDYMRESFEEENNKLRQSNENLKQAYLRKKRKVQKLQS